VPQGGSVEPFGLCPVPLDNEKWRVLQYFVHETLPVLCRSDILGFYVGTTAPTPQSMLQAVRNALSEELTTYALLTVSSGRMKFVSRASFSQPNLHEFMTDALLKSLQRRLNQAQPVDEILLLAIYLLCAAETYRKDWSAVQIHQKMLRHLYTTYLGGFHGITYYLRRMIWLQDRFIAMARATVPLVEVVCPARMDAIDQGVPPTVRSRVLRAIEANAQTPMGTNIIDCPPQLFCPAFSQLLNETTMLACILQCHWTGIRDSLPDHLWTHARIQIMLDRFLLYVDPRQPPATSELAILLQECVRISVITWLAFASSPATGTDVRSFDLNMKSRAAADARPLRQLLTALENKMDVDFRLPEHHKNWIDQLTFWLMGLGALASELKDNIDWFSSRFLRVASAMKPEVDSWEAFAPVGHRFLWLDRLEKVNDYRLAKLFETAATSRDIQSP
jgi:hypothetical protein